MTDLTKYDNMTLGDAQEIYMYIEENVQDVITACTKIRETERRNS